MAKHSSIFLIEDKHLDPRSSAKPFLQNLKWYLGSGFEFAHKQAADGNELLTHVKEWAGADDWDKSILYFWGHGSPNALWIGNEEDSDRVSLEQISTEINGGGDWEESALVHFGSCSTLRLIDDQFLRESGVAAVSGYRVEVDWIDSLAFEMLYMSRIQSVVSREEEKQPSEDVYLTPMLMRKVWEDLQGVRTIGLVDELHFDMRVASGRGA